MSAERKCEFCSNTEGIRVNFGNNIEAEKNFHAEEWVCDACRKTQ